MTKKSKTKPDVVQSTLRLPRALHRTINNVATLKNLSMQQAVQLAIEEYCKRETPILVRVKVTTTKHNYKSVSYHVPKKGGK